MKKYYFVCNRKENEELKNTVERLGLVTTPKPEDADIAVCVGSDIGPSEEALEATVKRLMPAFCMGTILCYTTLDNMRKVGTSGMEHMAATATETIGNKLSMFHDVPRRRKH